MKTEFGKWKIVEMLGRNNRYQIIAKCKCDCGVLKLVRLDHLQSGKTKSCGCLRDVLAKNRATTHGMSRTKTYKTWVHIKERCGNPKSKDWKDYGGRGIRISKKWKKSFKKFLADVGIIPSGLTLDRIDNNGHYIKSNVRIVPPIVQANNKRNTRRLTIGGTTKSIREWARDFNIKPQHIFDRIYKGWKPEVAFEYCKARSTFSTR